MNLHSYMMPETGDVELFSYAYDVTEKMENDELMTLISGTDFDYVGFIFPETQQFEFVKKGPQVHFSEPRVLNPYANWCSYVRENFITEEERESFDHAVNLPTILDYLKQNKVYVTSYRRNEKGKMTCKQLSYAWLDEAAQVILVVRSDVTAAYERDQKQLAEIEAAKMEADKANEAKSAFLSSMSHDIRTPLNGVLGFTNLALKETDPVKQRDYLEKIDSSGKLLLDLVNDTLELSRIESGKSVNEPEACDPEEIIPSVTTALRPSAELKNISFITHYENYPKEPLWCDRLKIQKIALNLLSNAIKYTPNGGKVTLSFENGEIGGVLKRLIFIVEDTGIGMSEEFMKRMYEPFSQEKRSEASKVVGTGLGLSIVKKFVEILGGSIEADSVVHQGTRFRVSLPISEVEEGQNKKAKKSQDLASLSGKRVLLCEDNALNSEIAMMLLKEKGIQVDLAEDGKIGYETLKASPLHHYDAILMDIRMPVMDGLEATKEIRNLERDDAKTMPIIAMTADAFEENIKAAQDVGMNGYITKPIIPEKMFEELAKVLKSAE
jgi:signal transduction histidine kinase/BarA-like signal transduction histidine kinase